MTHRRIAIGAAAVSMFLHGCAGGPPGPTVSAGAEQIRIYEPEQIRSQDYETVKLLWVDTLRSVFWVPESSSAEQGVAALRAEASQLGANALTGVACYANKGGQFTVLPLAARDTVSICYGRAIRVRQQ